MDANATTETQSPFWSLSDAELSSRIESACKIASAQYAAGADTRTIDAQVDALMAESDRRTS